MTVESTFTASAYIADAERLYQLAVEAVLQPTDTQARLYQASVEAVIEPTDTQARLYQLSVEVIVKLWPSFTADASLISKVQGSVSIDALLTQQVQGSFSTDAWVAQTLVGALTAASWITSGEQIHEFTADAIIEITWGPWSETESGINPWTLIADAIVAGISEGIFRADAVIIGAKTGSFTANALLRSTTTGQFSADAFKQGVYPITANAIIGSILGGTFTAAAWLISASWPFSADAIIRAPITQSFTARSIITRTQAASTTADAYLAFRLTLDAVLVRIVNGAFTARSISRETQTGSLTVDAYLAFKLTLDAVIVVTIDGSITASADLRETKTGSITADAYLVGRLTANAIILAPISGSFTAKSTLWKQLTVTFPADAYIAFRLIGDATIKASITSSFTARAWFYVPRTDPPLPGQTKLIEIFVDGVEITDDVMFSQATFTQSVNGAPGSFSVRVNDPLHMRSFTSGSEIRLDIDGKTRFGGYITMVHRGFVFPYEDTANVLDVDRYWLLEGVDYNILFTKRILYDKAMPTNVFLREWPAGTNDDVIIKYMFDNYTDLGADGATYYGVSHVGSPNPDKNGGFGSAGMTFGDALTEINRLISAIWYFDQTKDLKYLDVDLPTGFKDLSDRPTAGQVGYRDLTIANSGTSLANDALVWGTGRGNDQMAFGRVTDTTSIATHGLWQYGELTSQLYQQASVDARADTIVNGTAQSLRGRKDDKVSWTLTTFDLSFMVGQKVSVESEVYGLSDVIPIRKMTITFPTPTDIQFQLVLSHEIDEPWNLYEWFFPKFDAGTGITIKPVEQIKVVLPPIPTPCEGTGGCTDEICGITDTFTRTMVSGWGTSDAGLVWDCPMPGQVSVDGSGGLITPAGLAKLYLPAVDSRTIRFQFTPTFASLGAYNTLYLTVYPGTINWRILSFWALSSHAEWNQTIQIGGPDITTTVRTSFGWVSGTTYDVLYVVDGTSSRVKVWVSGTTEPASWTLDDGQPAVTPPDYIWGEIDFEVYGEMDYLARIDNLDITGVDRCTAVQFDDFERTVASGWGSSTPSGIIWYTDGPGTAVTSVGGGYGKIEQSATYTGQYQKFVTDGPWGGDFTLTERFRIEALSSGNLMQIGTRNAELTGRYIDEGPGVLVSYGGHTGLFFTGNDGVTTYADRTLPVGEYIIVWQKVGGSHSVKIWPTSETEPETWDISVSGYLTYTPDRLVILSVASSTWKVWFDSIDFDYTGKPCYTGDCRITDTFTRTTTEHYGNNSPSWNTWGDIESGNKGPYFVNQVYDASSHVDGSKVIVHHDGDSTSTVDSWNDFTALSLIGASDSGWAPNAAIDQLAGSYVVSIRFKFDIVPDGYNDNVHGFTNLWFKVYFETGLTGSGYFDWTLVWPFIQVSSDPAYGCIGLEDRNGYLPTSNRTVKTDWTANVWYRMKFEKVLNPATVKFKVWKESDTEPDWDFNNPATEKPGVDPAISDPNDYLAIVVSDNRRLWDTRFPPYGEGVGPVPLNVEFDDLDISGGGTCDVFLVDDFERTIAPGGGWGTGGLGTWVWDGGTHGWEGVDGEAAFTDWPTGQGGNTLIVHYHIDPVIEAAFLPFEYTIETTITTNGTTQLEFGSLDLIKWFGGSLSGTGLAGWVDDWTNYGPPDYEYDEWTGSAAKTGVIGVKHTVRARFEATTFRLKAWPSASAEPGAWDVVINHAMRTPTEALASGLRADLRIYQSKYSGRTLVHLITITMTDPGAVYGTSGGIDPDCVEPPVAGPSVANATGTGSQTVFHLPVRFVAGSTRVWIDGYFMRPGASYDYTEQPDAGTITFDFTPEVGSIIHIEYEANGSL